MRSKQLLPLILAVFVSLPAAQAVANGRDLTIQEVFVLASADPPQLQIIGQDFDFGPGPLKLSLGTIADLTILSASPDEIYAALPDGLVAGDYALLVKNGNSKRKEDTYHLTIGGGTGPGGVLIERTIVNSDTEVALPGAQGNAAVVCPPGTLVVGGGGGALSATPNTRLIQSNQLLNNIEGWFVQVANDGNVGEFIGAWAICLSGVTEAQP